MYKTITLPSFTDQRGTLAVAEMKKQFNFPIRRLFYMTAVPKGQKRGFHAHKKSYLALICATGSVKLVIDDCKNKLSLRLQKNQMFIIPPLVWHHLENFQQGTIIICLSSTTFIEADYIRDHNQFKKTVCS